MSKKSNNIFSADMHTHSNNSFDSDCRVEEMCEMMIKKGVSAFAVTDHFDAQNRHNENEYTKIINSVKDTEAAAEKFNGKLTILKGVELAEGFWDRKMVERVVNMCDYDVVIGSVHQPVNNTSFSQMNFSALSEEETDALLNTYYDDCLKLLSDPYFDIFAHLNFPLRYITGKHGKNIELRKYEEKIDKILKLIIDNNIVLEINTSNIGTNYDEFMPNEDIIKTYIKMGGKLFSLGSDAHIAENAAKGFERAFEMLKNLGVTSCCCFKNRQRIMYDI